MSTFTAPIGVGNIDNREFVYVDALVDTGATYSMFPREFLEDIHVEQSWTIDFKLARLGAPATSISDRKPGFLLLEHRLVYEARWTEQRRTELYTASY